MNALITIKHSDFFKLCLRAFEHARIPLRNFYRSKKMYNNFVHVFLLVLKQRTGMSYRKLSAFAEEMGLQRMLCIKRIPHFTTMQKAMQRLSKSLLEKMVKACHSLLDMKGMLVGIDGTGFSNTNPSHYYIKRIDGVKVKNFTKTVLIADLESKLVLGLKTHSDYSSETLDFIPLVKELKHTLKCVLADKGYDSKKNREYCWENGIENHTPVRKHKSEELLYGRKLVYKSSHRRKAVKLFDEDKYKRRALIESVNSAIKRSLGSWVCSRKPVNQQKEVTIKILAYNLEIMGRKITSIIIYIQTAILHRLAGMQKFNFLILYNNRRSFSAKYSLVWLILMKRFKYNEGCNIIGGLIGC